MFKPFRAWLKDDRGVSAVEAALIFPIMVTMLCGTIDTGVGLVTNQKVINAVQTVGDILAREEDVTNAELNDAIVSGQLSLSPYSTTSFGIDIAGIQFKNTTLTPTVIWRDTVNMSPNTKILDKAARLGKQDEGVLGLTVRYIYYPYFTAFAVGSIEMKEVSYVRGRRGYFVTRSP